MPMRNDYESEDFTGDSPPPSYTPIPQPIPLPRLSRHEDDGNVIYFAPMPCIVGNPHAPTNNDVAEYTTDNDSAVDTTEEDEHTDTSDSEEDEVHPPRPANPEPGASPNYSFGSHPCIREISIFSIGPDGQRRRDHAHGGLNLRQTGVKIPWLSPAEVVEHSRRNNNREVHILVPEDLQGRVIDPATIPRLVVHQPMSDETVDNRNDDCLDDLFTASVDNSRTADDINYGTMGHTRTHTPWGWCAVNGTDAGEPNSKHGNDPDHDSKGDKGSGEPLLSDDPYGQDKDGSDNHKEIKPPMTARALLLEQKEKFDKRQLNELRHVRSRGSKLLVGAIILQMIIWSVGVVTLAVDCNIFIHCAVGALLFVQLLNNRRVKAELERVLARKKAKKRAAARAARMAKAEADVTWAQLSHLVEEEACDLDTAIVEGLPYGVIERQINFMLQKLQELRESGAGAGHGEHMERIVELLEKARQRARNPSA